MKTDERPLVRELFLKMKLELFRPSGDCGVLPSAVYLRARQCARYLRQGYLLLCRRMWKAFLRKDAQAVPIFSDGRCIGGSGSADDFLPDVVSRTILTTKNREQAFSKFAACSLNG
ncbi:MAG: hypothetical protein V8Q32_08585 [Anaerotignum faecicola]